MAAAPVLPTPPAPNPQPQALSQVARIVDTFIAPSKTFTDLRRSAAWWAPFLLMVLVSTALVYTAGQKVGFRKIMENQMQAQPKAQDRLERLSPDDREQQLEKGAKFTGFIAYAFPVITLIMWLIIATFMFATFKVAAGADVSFGAAFAIVVYAGLPLMLKSILAIVSLLAGVSPDSFTFQNPVATNAGYFMTPASGVFLYSVATSLDIFLIWTLVLTAIGFTCAGKVKSGTSYAIVFGWALIFIVGGAALSAVFS
jgi:hypothetical protein